MRLKRLFKPKNIYKFVIIKFFNKEYFIVTNNQSIMKKLNYLALFAFVAFILSSCGGLNKMQENASDVTYDVTPEVLEERGDQVDVKIDVRYPAKYFNKKAILTATPVLV